MLLSMGASPLNVRCARALALAIVAAAGLIAAPAGAQELIHTFTNPSFGGNPFNSDHLFATANIHRPSEPDDDEDPATPEEQLVSTLRSQLTSSLSTEILQRIRALQVGQSGQYVLGDQIISFTRTSNGTTVTFTNTRTGESTQVVIPVIQSTTQSLSSASFSEQLIGPSGASSNGTASAGEVSSPEAGLLSSQPPL